MRLSELLQFEKINFDELVIPEFVTQTQQNFNIENEKANYVLEQNQYAEFASRWARVLDWYSIQYARAKYYKKMTEAAISRIYMEVAGAIPDTIKTKAGKTTWVEQNSPEYHKANEVLAKAEAYLLFFENACDNARIKHYLCKSQVQSIDRDKPVSGF
jgi:hypothetical protein